MAENAKLKIKEATAREIRGCYALALSAKACLAAGTPPLAFQVALTAAAGAEPKQPQRRCRRFTNHGTDIAKGGNGRPATGG